jgi:threonine/homoserine/homoserine lactone efflux protein
MDIISKGIVSGLVLALMIGPVFFTIIQTSIERGFSNGVFVAIGVSISDAMYILISYFGLTQFLSKPEVRLYMAYGGGAVLLAFGIYYLFVKSRKLGKVDYGSLPAKSWQRLAMKGFIINGLTPTVFFFWLGVVSVATTEFGYQTKTQALTYFAAIVSTVFITDVIKAKLADKLRVVMTPQFIRVMNIVLGIVLVVFAGKLILYPEI